MSTRSCINLERPWSANFQEIQGDRTAFLEVNNRARYSLGGSQTGILREPAMDLWLVVVRKLFFIIPERDRDP